MTQQPKERLTILIKLSPKQSNHKPNKENAEKREEIMNEQMGKNRPKNRKVKTHIYFDDLNKLGLDHYGNRIHNPEGVSEYSVTYKRG